VADAAGGGTRSVECRGQRIEGGVTLFCHAQIFLGAIWCDLVRLGANPAVFLRLGLRWKLQLGFNPSEGIKIKIRIKIRRGCPEK
jgi:hypothetical protein